MANSVGPDQTASSFKVSIYWNRSQVQILFIYLMLSVSKNKGDKLMFDTV